MKEEIPEHVSWRVRDAWKANPPCWGPGGDCHCDCPYFDDCWPEEEHYEDDEEWEEYSSARCAPIDGDSC